MILPIIIAVLFAVPSATLMTAVVTGQQKELCTFMEGTYQPTAPDHCPDGKWSKVYEYVYTQHAPQPK